jgi:hypothetical protein
MNAAPIPQSPEVVHRDRPEISIMICSNALKCLAGWFAVAVFLSIPAVSSALQPEEVLVIAFVVLRGP